MNRRITRSVIAAVAVVALAPGLAACTDSTGDDVVNPVETAPVETLPAESVSPSPTG